MKMGNEADNAFKKSKESEIKKNGEEERGKGKEIKESIKVEESGRDERKLEAE